MLSFLIVHCFWVYFYNNSASTLRLTTSTFVPVNQSPSMEATVPGGGLAEQDYRQRYDAACKAAKQWEKKYSAAQQQIYYERERWEGKVKTIWFG